MLWLQTLPGDILLVFPLPWWMEGFAAGKSPWQPQNNIIIKKIHLLSLFSHVQSLNKVFDQGGAGEEFGVFSGYSGGWRGPDFQNLLGCLRKDRVR